MLSYIPLQTPKTEKELTGLESFSDDVFTAIALLIDPLSIHSLICTSKFFCYKLLNNHFMWEEYARVFPQRRNTSYLELQGHTLFKTKLNDLYEDLTREEKQIFIAVVANKRTVEIIATRNKIKFTAKLLVKRDALDSNLLSEIRKTGDRKLYNYIFNDLKPQAYLVINNDRYNYCLVFDKVIYDNGLLYYGVHLDLGTDNEYFVELLKKQNESLLNALLMTAIDDNSVNSFRLLLQLVDDPNDCNNTQLISPLQQAAFKNNIEIVDLLLADPRTVVNQQVSREPPTALGIAARCGYIEIVKKLVKHNADINAGIENISPLYEAMSQKRTDVIEYLLEKDADTTRIQNDGFYDLLWCATAKNYLAGLKLIIEHRKKHSIPLNLDIVNGTIPLLYAAAKDGHIDICEYLLQLGAKVDIKIEDGSMPLHIACKNYHFSVVKILVKYRADVNACTNDQFTPLHFALKTENLDMMKCLIRAGAILQDIPNRISVHDCNIKQIILLLEKIAACNLSAITYVAPSYTAKTSEIISAIDTFLNDKKNAACHIEAKNCKLLLQETFTLFGCSVILYALMNKEIKLHVTTTILNHQNEFIPCIIRALGYESKNTAKNGLTSAIFNCLPDKLFEQIKKDIIPPLTEYLYATKEVSVDDFKKITIALNMIEAQVNKSAVIQAKYDQPAERYAKANFSSPSF